MLKAIAAIYLPTPAQEPARELPPASEDTAIAATANALVPTVGVTILQPGETFDPELWGIDQAEAEHLVMTGAADALPAEPDAGSAQVGPAEG